MTRPPGLHRTDPPTGAPPPGAAAAGDPGRRNAPRGLDLGRVLATRVAAPAVAAQAAALGARHPAGGAARAGWLARALTLIDLTTLAGDDTPGHVARLCARARRPLPEPLAASLGLGPLTTAAVCVYHEMVPAAVAALTGSGLPVAAVSAGFPAGLSPFPQRLAEIGASVDAGAQEIDIVISRRHAILGDWPALYEEMRAFREACGEAHVKAILATGELGSLTNVARASLVCMMAGADFIKTSTGKEAVNATLPVALTMIRQIRAFHALTGVRVGFKPAGGISKAGDALAHMALVREELGAGWLAPPLFRFGASSLLAAIEAELARLVPPSGRPA